jgi:hypothetical protein
VCPETFCASQGGFPTLNLWRSSYLYLMAAQMSRLGPCQKAFPFSRSKHNRDLSMSFPVSPSTVPTINSQIRPCHEAASIADEKNSCPSVFLWLAQSVQHVLLRPLVLPLGILHEQSFNHRRHDITWGYGVYPDTVHAPFGGQVASQLHDTCLRGVVSRAYQTLDSVSKLPKRKSNQEVTWRKEVIIPYSQRVRSCCQS